MKKLLLALLALLTSRASFAQAPPTPAVITALMQQVGVPGMQLVYTRGGRTQAYALGQRTAGQPAAVDAGTTFEAASLGKAVLAYVALRLLDRGLLDLDKPLLAYAPYQRLQDEPRAGKITGRMVLGHTSACPTGPPTPPRRSGSPPRCA